MEDITRVPSIAQKSLLKWKLNSIGVLNIGKTVLIKDRDKIKRKKQRPAQKNIKNRMGDQLKTECMMRGQLIS